MKRRKLIQYGALGSATFLINFGLLNYQEQGASLPTTDSTVASQPHYDWIILYWMPYDNNLSKVGQPILQMLSQGVQSENILIGVQSDFTSALHLQRNIIVKGKNEVEFIESADSSNEEIFAEYLNWAATNYSAEKWAIIFLGHGGRIDEISPDEHTDGRTFATKWMNISKLSQIISNFNKKINERIELLFFQNCCKGTLEVNYTFRYAAKYTLSSQLELGAPNYYYENLLQYLGIHPEIDGAELAEKIMEFERKDMYHSYTAINNTSIRDLPNKLNPLINKILSLDTKLIDLNEKEIYGCGGDRFVDLLNFFQKITNWLNAGEKEYENFHNFVENQVICKFVQDGKLFNMKVSRNVKNKYQHLRGLSLFFPENRQYLDAYRYLEVYSDLNLINLFDKILFN